MSKDSGGGKADVVGAARETGQQARWLAREQTLANRPNQINPWGSTTWIRSPVTSDSYFTGGSPAGTAAATAGSSQPASAAQYTPQTRAGRKWSSELDDYVEDGGRGDLGSRFDESLYDYQAPTDAPFNDLPLADWTQIETLNPKLQDALDAQFDQIKGRSELAASLLPQLQQDMGTPMDWSQFGDVIGFDPEEQRKLAEDASYQRSVNRLDPRFQEEANALEVNLRNKGLRPGDQAYDSAMANFGRTKNDAYEQARLGATTEGRSETELGMQTNQLANALRTQRMQEELYKRGYTLEQINALMQGQEIEGSTPSMNEKSTIADILNGGNAGLLGGG